MSGSSCLRQRKEIDHASRYPTGCNFPDYELSDQTVTRRKLLVLQKCRPDWDITGAEHGAA